MRTPLGRYSVKIAASSSSARGVHSRRADCPSGSCGKPEFGRLPPPTVLLRLRLLAPCAGCTWVIQRLNLHRWLGIFQGEFLLLPLRVTPESPHVSQLLTFSSIRGMSPWIAHSSTSANVLFHDFSKFVLQWCCPKHQEAVGLRGCCLSGGYWVVRLLPSVLAPNCLLATSAFLFRRGIGVWPVSSLACSASYWRTKLKSVFTSDLVDMKMVRVFLCFWFRFLVLPFNSLLICLGELVIPLLLIPLSHIWPYPLALFILHFQGVLLQMMSGSLSFHVLSFVILVVPNKLKFCSTVSWDFNVHFSCFFLILQMGLLLLGEHIQHILLLYIMSDCNDHWLPCIGRHDNSWR
jgi:hypothetical protein